MTLKTERIIAFLNLRHQGITWVSPRINCSPKQRFQCDKTAASAQTHNALNHSYFRLFDSKKAVLNQLLIHILWMPSEQRGQLQ